MRSGRRANWGTTGYVHCIHTDQLVEDIANDKGGEPLPAADIPRPCRGVALLREAGLISAAKGLKETIVDK